jgi:putative spermidine/putrescine transport system permease protein
LTDLSKAERSRRFYAASLLIGPSMLLVLLPFVASLFVLAAYSVGLQPGGTGFTLDVWTGFLTDSYSWVVIGTSVRLAAIVTVLSLLIGYPVACALVRLENPILSMIAYTVIFSPLLMSVVVRSYGWLLLLSDGGFVNSLLGAYPLNLGPFRLIYNETGVIIALVHILLPFAVLPLITIMLKMPQQLREAAADLGASSLEVFFKVTLPLSLPGIIVAAEIVFALAVSAFVTPAVLGGGRVLNLSRLVYENINNVEWALAAVQALILLAFAVGVLVVLERFNRKTYGEPGQ